MNRQRAFSRHTTQTESNLPLPPQVYRSAVPSLHEINHTLGNRVLGQFIQTKLNAGDESEPEEKDNPFSSEMGPLPNRPPQEEETAPEKENEEPEAEVEPEAQPEAAAESEVSPPLPPPEEPEEETVVQSKNISGAAPHPRSTEHYVNSIHGGGEPLTKAARDFFEPRFGRDFSEVRVHTDAGAATSAQDLNALAYTIDRNVVFGAGNYAPDSDDGKRLLAHELAHVVQQVGRSQKPKKLGLSDAREPAIQRQSQTPRRVEGTVNVSWIDDDVEFYHRVINATARNRNYRGIRTASLWQPLHDPIFAMYRRLGLNRPALREGQTVSLRVSVFFDPTVFHGQVTDGRVETEQAAQLRAASITGVLAARETFTGRSTTQFGLAEVVDLSFTAAAGVTAASLGGLKWFKASGDGTVTGGNDGLGVFTAAATPGRVQLELRIVSGLETGRVVATHNIRVIQPSGAVMQKDSRDVKHTHNYWGIGFCGESFLRPTDVSFRALQIQEGRTTAVADGFLQSRNGVVHPEGSWFDVLRGNNTTGCQIDSLDSVRTADLPGPYSDGDFLWRIPWNYRVGTSGAAVQFTTADQHATADASGTATIQKIGSPVFSKAASDATVDYDCY